MSKNPYVFPAIIIALGIFLAGAVVGQSPARAEDQYLVKDGKVLRFSGNPHGRVEVLDEKTGDWRLLQDR